MTDQARFAQRIAFLLALCAVTAPVGTRGARAADPPGGIGPTSTITLWPAGAPGSEGKRALPEIQAVSGAGGAGGAGREPGAPPSGSPNLAGIHNPSLLAFLPGKARATGDAVVVLPGGGHRVLVIEKEGFTIARWLVSRGIAAFVLKYRLAREAGSSYRVEVESLQDVQRALRTVKSRAAAWGVHPARVGVMGFSAGGELAALAAMRGDAVVAAAKDGRPAPDEIDRLSARPAFQALVYPAASQNIAPVPGAPPAFIVAGNEDRPDISEGVARAYLAFKQAGVPVELHVYAGVGHGFALQPGPAAGWIVRFTEWLRERAVNPSPAPPAASRR